MRPLIAYISKQSFKFNIQKLKARSPDSKLCLVVKANAYGHHIDGIINELNHADYLAVAYSEEAVHLRCHNAQKPIILLEGVFEINEYETCINQSFEPVIANDHQLDLLEKYIELLQINNNHKNQFIPSKFNIWIKIDTGMNRLGIRPKALDSFILRLKKLRPIINQINIMMHFACADTPEHPLNAHQIEQFNALDHPDIHYKSACNSAGLLNFPNMHHNLLRAGLISYGVSPIPNTTGANLGFQPIMTLKTKIINLKWVLEGESIGYGAHYIATQKCHVAIIACGYADGYPREVSTDAYVSVEGINAPIIGRISMDMICIDVTHLKSPKIGTDVILWGSEIPVEYVAKWSNTIPYTLLTRVSPRVHFQFI